MDHRRGPALLFDLDATLVDSVYQHVIAWRDALEQAGIELAVWRIHRARFALAALGVGLLSGGYGEDELDRGVRAAA